MKCFLEKNDTIDTSTLIKSLKNSLENNDIFALLATCFIIPDILSKNNDKYKGNNKQKYINWVNDNISDEFLKMINNDKDLVIENLSLKGDLFYQLRCSFLHAGNNIICNKVETQFDKIEYIYNDKDSLACDCIEIVTADNSFKVLNDRNEFKLIHTEERKVVTTKIKINVNRLARLFIDVLNDIN